ncbi:MAG: zinc-ribbon domain-containing protein [Oscillospiraceae bacterium]|nr:zinc-ribbon domain-containing protein [Oscillospiraceae bacterium]
MDTNELKLRLKRFGIDVKDSAGKLTKNAVDGSKKLTEKIRVQNNIRKAETQLKQTYAEMGQKYEELYGSRNDAEFAPYMTKLADLRAQIAAARAELSSLDSAVVCKNCGKYVLENQNFCPYCGTKIILSQPVEAEVVSSGPDSPAPEPQENQDDYDSF